MPPPRTARGIRGLIKNHFAFTLAEVLITLGIIGVIAALTLPNLIASYQKKETVTKLKKTVSILSQAVKLSEITNDNTENWDYTLPAKEFYDKYLKDFLISSEEVKLSEIRKRIRYKYLNNTDAEGAVGNDNSYVAKLSNGTFIIVDGWFDPSGTSRGVNIDINGFAKPNKIGKDVFYFGIEAGKGYAYSYDENSTNVWASCNKYQSGYACGSKIIHDGWEIKNDYPW